MKYFNFHPYLTYIGRALVKNVKSDLPYKVKKIFFSDFNIFGVKWSAFNRLKARKKLEVKILILAKVMEKIKSKFFRFTAPPCESGFFENSFLHNFG